MLEKTNFTNKSITNIIFKKYGIAVKKIEKLNQGSANIFLLNDKYILKEFQSKYNKEEIIKEIKVINHLRNDNLPVPEYIKTLSNRYYFIYKSKIVVMQKYIKGYTIDSNTGTYEQDLESARYLGKIIKSLESLKIKLPQNNVKTWALKEKFDKSISKYKSLLIDNKGKYKEQVEQDLNDKIKMIESISKMDFNDIDKMTVMNTHGDYSLLQFIYDNGKIKSIIDFVSACKMVISWEVIRSFSYIDSLSKDGLLNINNLVDYVKEFSKYIKLNKYDIKYMPYIYLIQILNSDYGYKQYIKDGNEKLIEFAFYRTNLCRFLFDNAEKISNALESSLND